MRPTGELSYPEAEVLALVRTHLPLRSLRTRPSAAIEREQVGQMVKAEPLVTLIGVGGC
jgi:hypothetical protein